MEGPNLPSTSQIRKLGPPPLKKGVNYVNVGEEDQMVMQQETRDIDSHLSCSTSNSTKFPPSNTTGDHRV